MAYTPPLEQECDWWQEAVNKARREVAALDLLTACEARHSKFGNAPDTLDFLAQLLETGDLHQNEKAWAVCLHRIAEQQHAAIAKAKETT